MDKNVLILSPMDIDQLKEYQLNILSVLHNYKLLI
jgi:hypothetical protein